jgi:hypothetical protein
MSETPTEQDVPGNNTEELTRTIGLLNGMLAHFQQLHADEVFKNAKLTVQIQQLTGRAGGPGN